MNETIDTLKENIEKVEVLTDIYNELAEQHYPSKKERDNAKLKMKLVKKEILLLSYVIEKDIESISSS